MRENDTPRVGIAGCESYEMDGLTPAASPIRIVQYTSNLDVDVSSSLCSRNYKECGCTNLEFCLAETVKILNSTEPLNTPTSSVQSQATRKVLQCRPFLIKHRQQRLLLLWHASMCECSSGCRVTPHCAGAKETLAHISTCRVPSCLHMDCASSKLALNHYSKCKKMDCLICGPVLKYISRKNKYSSQRHHALCSKQASESDASMNQFKQW